MAGETSRFGFTTLDSPSDTLGTQGFKFVDVDRRRLDALLEYTERHQHAGQVAGSSVPPDPPLLRLEEPGRIPANTSVYYRYGFVDASGQEQVASRIASVITPSPMPTPAPPVLAVGVGGTLAAGSYRYGVSAFTPSSAYETPLSVLATITATGSVELTLPPVGGGKGLNVYRQGPLDASPLFLQQVSAGVTTFSDMGQIRPDGLRAAPITNTTYAANAVQASPPFALGPGESWRLYRTFDLETWYDTLIAWNTGEDVIDAGFSGGASGSPLTTSSAVGGPPRIDLTLETVGLLPTTRLSHIEIVDFALPGRVSPTQPYLQWQWVNEFNTAKVLALRANLAQGSTAVAQAVIVAIEYLSGAGWVRYPQTASIPVGQTVGSVTWITQSAATALPVGAALRAIVIQDGGPTTTDLVVAVRLECQA